MRRIFGLWNRSYGIKWVLAVDQEEAIACAVARKAIRNRHSFRRIVDLTDVEVEADPTLEPVLSANRSGVLTKGDDGSWLIDNKPI